MPSITNEQLTGPLFALLSEAYEKPIGVFLDRDTNLFKSVDSLSAKQASTPIIPDGTTIAGHVFHLRFYLKVTYDFIDGTAAGDVDWKDSWVVREVSDAEWETLRAGIREDFAGMMKRFGAVTDWTNEKQLGAALGILAHTAFHLGAIRQMMKVVRRG